MKNPLPTVFLVGMPGCGKSTIGRSLAKALQRDFIDLDHEIERRCGVRIPVIFEIEGEKGFRARETQVLDEVSKDSGKVIATGGGAILQPRNRELLSERGQVVYLKASIEELYRRTSRDRSRPLLNTPDPKARLKELFAVRGPFYEALADRVVETGTSGIASVVERLATELNQRQEQI
jgi:shikimate kinase